jgi:hypothetical protein
MIPTLSGQAWVLFVCTGRHCQLYVLMLNNCTYVAEVPVHDEALCHKQTKLPVQMLREKGERRKCRRIKTQSAA